MYTMCVTEKTAKQQLIFEQTFLQMLLESDYDAVTVSDLCRRAGLSRKIFYRLFEKKADVLYSLIDHTLLESVSFEPDASVAPGELHRFLAFWKTQKDLLDVLLKHQNSHLLTDRAIRMAFDENTSLIHTFGADIGEFGYERIVFCMSGIFSIILLWHTKGFAYDINALADLMMDILSTSAIKHPLTNQPLL